MTIVVDSSVRASSALDIITSAYKITGEYGAGETVSDDDAQDGLNALNDLLDSWWNDRLAIHQIYRESFTLTANDGQYTIGSGGDFNTTRPVKIVDAFVRTTENIDYPLTIIDTAQGYNRIAYKSTTSDISGALFYDNAYPLGTIFLYPVPTVANTLYLFSWKQLQSFTSLTAQVSLPPGYERALKYNLAKELNTLANGAMTPDAKEIAVESLAKIKRTNRRPIVSRTDITVGREYDITSDTYL